MLALWAVHGLADLYSETAAAGFFNGLDHFDPYYYQMRLWEPGYATVGPAMGILAGLGVLYLVIGLAFYLRRDL
jgi:hypothetical protein